MTSTPTDQRRWALDGAQARRVHDALWTLGDYTRVAEKLTALSIAVVEAAEIRGGQDVLDIGAGAGNTAVDAARAGGRVVSGDLSGDLFDACRRRAEQAGVTVDWIQLNPEQLPLPPGSVDRVLSAAGGPLAFAPDPARVAQELARVLRPGGLAVLASWTRQGLAGQVSATMARYLPAPSPGGADPWTWADEASVEALLMKRRAGSPSSRGGEVWRPPPCGPVPRCNWDGMQEVRGSNPLSSTPTKPQVRSPAVLLSPAAACVGLCALRPLPAADGQQP
jgi:SAM-dependent methyltransferase